MTFTIVSNQPLTASVYRMRLAGDTSACRRPGQFVQVAVPGFYLRRPISVCDWTPGEVTLVYKTVGAGTAAMAAMAPGTQLDLLTGLGNGFSVDESLGEKPLLVGGGVGLPPLLGQCRALLATGRRPSVLAGFGTAAEVFLQADFEALGVPFHVTTLDGSMGTRGLVTDALGGLDFTSICACGPIPMMRALYRLTDCPAQFSLEERMGCGFGACMGCSIETAEGPRRVCADGPVFRREALLWQT